MPNWLNSQIYGIIDKTSKRCKAVSRGTITTNQVCILYFDVWTKRISEGDHAKNCILVIEVDADSKIVESFDIAAFDDFNKTIFCDKYF